jgi:hypothetical protein
MIWNSKFSLGSIIKPENYYERLLLFDETDFVSSSKLFGVFVPVFEDYPCPGVGTKLGI